MKYYCVEPEVAGGWGKNTVVDSGLREGPASVSRLHYEFDGWLGDELLTSTPCFIVSERLAREIEGAQLTGVWFDELEVTTSGEFADLYPTLQLPKFVWLRIDGRPGQDDFGLAKGIRLVVSERAWELIKHRASNAIVAEFAA